MNFRPLFFIAIIFSLTACSFSLAEDVTPPPNYVPPTPVPTLGLLYPSAAPDPENGARLYAEKCAACHGTFGMGDGADGRQLPVTVPALALPQTARGASPSGWYTIVTRGNLERFMPPFASLTSQERWDVVFYSLSLHTTPEQAALGQSIIETNCVDCPLDFFKNQEEMTALSADDLVFLLKNGNEQVRALDGNLSEADLYAAAAYLRTLAFAVASTPTPEPVIPTPTLAAPEATSTEARVESGTPAVDATPFMMETPIPSEEMPDAAGHKVTGSVSGKNVEGLTVTLRGFDHASDASGPQEILTLTAVTNADGSFMFEQVDFLENRIFFTEVQYEGVIYRSNTMVTPAGAAELNFLQFPLYETTTDFSSLSFHQVHFFIDISDGTAQVISVYTFSNKGTQTIAVDFAGEIPFVKTPANAQDIGFELTQDSAPLLEAETGFAIPPSETPYGIVTFYSLPYEKEAQISQPFALSASSVLVLVPDGVKMKTDQMLEGDLQNFRGANYREYIGGAVRAGDTLVFDLSGTPKTAGLEAGSSQNLLIGLGVFGVVLILAGAWMYLRERNRVEDDEFDEEDEFETEEEILDAIIALDDLHRAGKINGEAYQERREELKGRLK